MEKLSTNLIKATLFSLLYLICLVAYPATYYFSSSLGDDARSSAQAQNQNTPWRSIQKLNSIFTTLQPGDNILFKNGDTFQGTITITKSGTAGAPISFGSYGSGEKPVLTGFREIKDWVSKGGNVYEALIPEITTALSTVVIDNILQAMGRYPNDNAANSGYLTINSFSGGTIGSSGMQAPANMAGGEIVIRKNNWIIDRHYINWQSGTSVNYNTAGSSYSPAIGFGFFIQNHPATLDKHGEWYFDKATKKLTIFYQGNPSAADIRVATVDRVINTLNSASQIKFSNLTIQGSNENLINVDKSSYFTIENCQLEYVGKNAINTMMSRNLTVSNSQIENVLNGGINLGWDDRATVVRNSTFSKIHAKAGMGQSADSQGNGIFMSETSSDVLVEYSTFLENGYNAIYFHGNNITVKNNLIDTFCFVKDDGGGIYTFTGPASTTFVNRKITNNIIVNGIGAVGGTKPYGANDFPYVEGIYLDLFANGIEIDGNTIGNVKSKGIFVNNSRNVSITNNKIFNTGYSIFITSDYTDNLTRNITLKDNEFLKKTSNQLHIYVRSKVNTLGQMGTFENNVYSRPVNESNAINLQTPGKNGLIDLQIWKDTYGLDITSTKSPVAYDPNKMSIDEFILFDYNYSNSAKSLPLSGTYVDLKGKIISGSVSVPAYSSVLLLKTQAGAVIENVAPTVSITAPTANAQFTQGNNISITANAADSDGTITKVDFYNGTTLLGTDTTSPYSFAWVNLPLGSFSLTAKATDNKGLATVSAPVSINVGAKPNVAPTVSITAPAANAQFIQGNNISITSVAADSDGTITKVDFFSGTTLLGTDTTSPYSFSWTNLAAGSFSLTAKATDDKGTATVSAPVAINVVVNPNVAPTVSITAPAANAQLSQGDNISITSVAADSDGTITKVDFFNGTTLLGTDTTSPYSFAWANLPVGSFSLTAKATDDKGTATVSAPVSINVVVKTSRSPYGGTAAIIPGTVEAENYDFGGLGVTYHDVDAGNKGGVYRTDDVDINAAVEGGFTVGWMNLSEWLEYTVNITVAGAYSLDARVASPEAGGTFHIECNGVDVTGPLTVPATGGWDTWTSVTKTGVNLPAGTHVLRYVLDSYGASGYWGNLNTMHFTLPNVAPTVNITGPAANAQFIQGDNISITANAADSDGTITKVDFYNGTTLLGTDTTSPYSFAWANLPVGSFSLTARATDNKGTVTVSAPVSIIVVEKANVAPTVSITGPAANAQFIQGDNISITANAADSDGTITKVDFYNGTTLLGTDTTSPYSFATATLPVGSYSLTARATDNKGTVTVSTAVAINVVDKPNVAPTVSITAPAANAQFIQGDNISITANAADSDGTIAKVDFYNGTTLLGTDTTSPYSFATATLPVGSYSLTARATDNKGTVTVSTAVAINVVDKPNVAPTVSITGPAANAQFIQGDNISITANAADSDGTIAKVDFYNGTTLLGTDTTSPYSFATATLPVGSYSLTARATDNKGTVTVSTAVAINVVDKPNVAPTVSITGPAANAQFIQGDNISITANAADSDGTIAKVDFYNGSTLLGTDTASPYSFATATLPVGSYSLTARATDNKGTVTVSTAVAINVVDKPNVAPTVSITGPAANAQFIQGDNISITANAADSDGTITKVDFYNGTTLLGTDNTSPYSFATATLPVGSYSLTARATDDKGTVTVSTAVAINVVDKPNVAPTVSITGPAANAQFIQGDNISITANAADSDGTITKVDFYNGSTLLGTDTASPYSFATATFPVGSYSLTARATDNKGTVTVSAPVSINVVEKANVAPTVSITGPAANAQFTQGDTISITANAADSDGTITKVDFYNGSTLLGTDTTSPYSVATATLPVGSFSLTARATDNKGTVTVSAPVAINVSEKITEETPIEVVIPEPIIVTPVTNQEYEAGEIVDVIVMFQGSTETVKTVEYYSGSQLIGASGISPFDFTWQNPASGQHVITAKAIGSDLNNFKISESVSILVKEKIETVFQITDPIRDAKFIQGTTITINVDIPENSNPISRVEYFRGNIRIASSTSMPYGYTWTNAQQGKHNLVAQLIYVDGTKILSNPVPIEVLKKNQSVVKLVSPSNNREVQSGENLNLNVELLEFENKVEFVKYLLDGVNLGTSNTQPYGFQWKNIPEGNHELVAHAVDANGVSHYSEPLNISVRKDVKDVRLEYVIGPNPTTEYLNVIFTNLDGIYDFEFRVVSMNGMVQKIFKARPEDSTVTIDVSDLINGVYVLQLTANGNEVSSKKFIKK